ncbi:hypothetical protein OFB99_24770, partial [Escherichia coli]|nr:hypothetical protein [Escherichia coli]
DHDTRDVTAPAAQCQSGLLRNIVPLAGNKGGAPELDLSSVEQETGTEDFEQGKELKASWKEGLGVRTVTLSLYVFVVQWHSLPILMTDLRETPTMRKASQSMIKKSRLST